MWQDSGRYEWPLVGAPLSTANIPFVQTQIQEEPGQVVTFGATRDAALVSSPYENWHTITLPPRTSPKWVDERLSAIEAQVVQMRAQLAALESLAQLEKLAALARVEMHQHQQSKTDAGTL